MSRSNDETLDALVSRFNNMRVVRNGVDITSTPARFEQQSRRTQILSNGNSFSLQTIQQDGNDDPIEVLFHNIMSSLRLSETFQVVSLYFQSINRRLQRQKFCEVFTWTTTILLMNVLFAFLAFFSFWFRTWILQLAQFYTLCACFFAFTTLVPHYLLRWKPSYVILLNLFMVWGMHSLDYNTDVYLTNLDSQLGNSVFYSKLSQRLMYNEEDKELTILNPVASLLKITQACHDKSAIINEQCHEELKRGTKLLDVFMNDILGVMSDNTVVKRDLKASSGLRQGHDQTFTRLQNVIDDLKTKGSNDQSLKSRQNLIFLAITRLLSGNLYEDAVESSARNSWYSKIIQDQMYGIFNLAMQFWQLLTSAPGPTFQLLSRGKIFIDLGSIAIDQFWSSKHRYQDIVAKLNPDTAQKVHLWNVCNYDFCSNGNVRLSEIALDHRLSTKSSHIPQAYVGKDNSKCPSLSDIQDVKTTYIDMRECSDFTKLCLQGLEWNNRNFKSESWICPDTCTRRDDIKVVPICNNTREWCLQKYPAVCNETFANASRSAPAQVNFTCPEVNITHGNGTDDNGTHYNFTYRHWDESERFSTCAKESCAGLTGTEWTICYVRKFQNLLNIQGFTLLTTSMTMLMRKG